MIIRKEFVRRAKPQLSAGGQLRNAGGVFDLLCDEKSDLLSDDALGVGSMAYVRSLAQHRQVRVAYTGRASDWEPIDTNAPEGGDGGEETENEHVD